MKLSIKKQFAIYSFDAFVLTIFLLAKIFIENNQIIHKIIAELKNIEKISRKARLNLFFRFPTETVSLL
ncbi:MAG: hypothetical protein ABS44_02470 [Chryseobacterium sp. SCN 40-13]|nr:MAG: hypothetical protein ABS44_02470 [Chryseobacterium sp. SCN 40-13]